MVGKLYEQYYTELVRWCMCMTQERSAAEDLVQEAFLRAIRHEEELSGMDAPRGRAWLYRTVRNLYIDRKRHGKYETAVEEFPDMETAEAGYEIPENEELLSVLPEEEHKLFVMRYLEGYNSRELGELFDMPPATVRLRLASARKRLRKEMCLGTE